MRLDLDITVTAEEGDPRDIMTPGSDRRFCSRMASRKRAASSPSQPDLSGCGRTGVDVGKSDAYAGVAEAGDAVAVRDGDSRNPAHAVTLLGPDKTPGLDEIQYSEQPMRRQFRFASERQSGSSRLVAKRSPGCKHELCRFASNAVVMTLASGSDETRNSDEVERQLLLRQEAEGVLGRAIRRCWPTAEICAIPTTAGG